jgi:hypothetical protein
LVLFREEGGDLGDQLREALGWEGLYVDGSLVEVGGAAEAGLAAGYWVCEVDETMRESWFVVPELTVDWADLVSLSLNGDREDRLLTEMRRLQRVTSRLSRNLVFRLWLEPTCLSASRRYSVVKGVSPAS